MQRRENASPPLTDKNPPAPATVDPQDEAGIAFWLDHFGATLDQLIEAVKAVGSNPSAVREHLLNQGGSSGAG